MLYITRGESMCLNLLLLSQKKARADMVKNDIVITKVCEPVQFSIKVGWWFQNIIPKKSEQQFIIQKYITKFKRRKKNMLKIMSFKKRPNG